MGSFSPRFLELSERCSPPFLANQLAGTALVKEGVYLASLSARSSYFLSGALLFDVDSIHNPIDLTRNLTLDADAYFHAAVHHCPQAVGHRRGWQMAYRKASSMCLTVALAE